MLKFRPIELHDLRHEVICKCCIHLLHRIIQHFLRTLCFCWIFFRNRTAHVLARIAMKIMKCRYALQICQRNLFRVLFKDCFPCRRQHHEAASRTINQSCFLQIRFRPCHAICQRRLPIARQHLFPVLIRQLPEIRTFHRDVFQPIRFSITEHAEDAREKFIEFGYGHDSIPFYFSLQRNKSLCVPVRVKIRINSSSTVS